MDDALVTISQILGGTALSRGDAEIRDLLRKRLTILARVQDIRVVDRTVKNLILEDIPLDSAADLVILNDRITSAESTESSQGCRSAILHSHLPRDINTISSTAVSESADNEPDGGHSDVQIVRIHHGRLSWLNAQAVDKGMCSTNYLSDPIDVEVREWNCSDVEANFKIPTYEQENVGRTNVNVTCHEPNEIAKANELGLSFDCSTSRQIKDHRIVAASNKQTQILPTNHDGNRTNYPICNLDADDIKEGDWIKCTGTVVRYNQYTFFKASSIVKINQSIYYGSKHQQDQLVRSPVQSYKFSDISAVDGVQANNSSHAIPEKQKFGISGTRIPVVDTDNVDGSNFEKTSSIDDPPPKRANRVLNRREPATTLAQKNVEDLCQIILERNKDRSCGLKTAEIFALVGPSFEQDKVKRALETLADKGVIWREGNGREDSWLSLD